MMCASSITTGVTSGAGTEAHESLLVFSGVHVASLDISKYKSKKNRQYKNQTKKAEKDKD
jgi:hypothetical protein